MSKEFKLDIFETLAAIDRRDGNFLQKQTEEGQKAFAPRVVLRWASSVNGPLAEYYIEATNEIVNVNMDSLGDHPELQYRLLAMCGAGQRGLRHNWVPLPKASRKSSSKLHDYMAEYHPTASVAELDLLLSQYSRDEFEQFLRDAALSPAETKDLLNALDKSRGIEPKKTKAKKKS